MPQLRIAFHYIAAPRAVFKPSDIKKSRKCHRNYNSKAESALLHIIKTEGRKTPESQTAIHSQH